MKKVFPPFFLTIFLFNTVGYFVVFKVQQYQIENEIESKIRSGITTSELTTITINKNNLTDVQWLEKGTEMRYNGEMYDIVKSTETSNTITYSCVNDNKETSLFANLADHINTNISSNKPLKNSKKIIHNITKLYFSNGYSLSFTKFSSTLKFSESNLIFTSASLETNSPPPWFV